MGAEDEVDDQSGDEESREATVPEGVPLGFDGQTHTRAREPCRRSVPAQTQRTEEAPTHARERADVIVARGAHGFERAPRAGARERER